MAGDEPAHRCGHPGSRLAEPPALAPTTTAAQEGLSVAVQTSADPLTDPCLSGSSPRAQTHPCGPPTARTARPTLRRLGPPPVHTPGARTQAAPQPRGGSAERREPAGSAGRGARGPEVAGVCAERYLNVLLFVQDPLPARRSPSLAGCALPPRPGRRGNQLGARRRARRRHRYPSSARAAQARRGGGGARQVRRRLKQQPNGRAAFADVLTSPRALRLMGAVVFVPPRSGHGSLGCGRQRALCYGLGANPEKLQFCRIRRT